MTAAWIEALGDAEREKLREAAMPDGLAPMLATLTDDYFSDPGWIFERKLDGEVVAFDGNVTSFSRLQTRMQDDDPHDTSERPHKGHLRHPRYLGMRRDKDARDVAREAGGDGG